MPDSENAAIALLQAGILPMAPGPYLGRYVLSQRGDTPEQAAVTMGVDATWVQDLLHDRITIDVPLAERLGRYAETTTAFWLNLQAAWDYTKAAVKPADRARYIQVEPYSARVIG